MLALVLADRDLVGLVEQDVGDLEDRVGEQADGGAVGALLGGLVLELGHPARLAEAGEAVHHPGQLGMLGHMALHEQRAALRVEAGGQQLGGGDPGVGAQFGRVLRNGDRMQVDDHVEGVVGLLERHPLADRAEVVAEVEGAGGGLDAGEHTRYESHATDCLRSATGGRRVVGVWTAHGRGADGADGRGPAPWRRPALPRTHPAIGSPGAG